MRTLITNCPNCAAPLKDGKCPYCGTHVRLANELDIDFEGKPTEVMLNIKRGNDVILIPLVGRIDSIEMRDNHVDYMHGETMFIQRTATEVELTFRGYIKESI